MIPRKLKSLLRADGDVEHSESGYPILRHKSKKRLSWTGGDEKTVESVDRHIGTRVGKVDFVLHEILSAYVHVDIHHVPPSRERKYHTLVTSGMSQKLMKVPEEARECKYAELLLCLPPDWMPVDLKHKTMKEIFPDEEHYWPCRWLTELARFPHEYGTWLWCGHTVPNGDPPEALAGNTEMCCVLLSSPSLFPEEAHTIAFGRKKKAHLWAVIPIYPEELELKLSEGAERLEELFRKHGVTELLDPRRINVVTGKRPGALM